MYFHFPFSFLLSPSHLPDGGCTAIILHLLHKLSIGTCVPLQFHFACVLLVVILCHPFLQVIIELHHITWPLDPQSSRHLHVTSSNDGRTQCHFTLLLMSRILITITCLRATRRPSIQLSRATQRPFCYSSSHIITAASRIFIITLSRVAVYPDLYHCRRQPYAYIYHR